MGCNCNKDSVPLSLKQKMRREVKEKFAEVRRIWKESSGSGKITSTKEELGFKKTE